MIGQGNGEHFERMFPGYVHDRVREVMFNPESDSHARIHTTNLHGQGELVRDISNSDTARTIGGIALYAQEIDCLGNN